MYSIKRDLVNWEDRLVEVKRVVWEHHVKDIELVKEWTGADTVLRRDGRLFFCASVQEAEVIEDSVLEISESNSESDLDVTNE